MLKQRNSLFLTSTLTILFIFSRCDSGTNHNEKIKYFITITTNLNNFSYKNKCFFATVKHCLELSKHEQSISDINTEVYLIDSIYNEIKKTIPIAVKNIESLSELDSEICLKSKSIHFLLSTDKNLKQCVPLFFIAFKKGMYNITPKERSSLQNLVGEVIKLASELEQLSADFQKKHGITTNELKENGYSSPGNKIVLPFQLRKK